MFDVESILVQEDQIFDTNNTTWIGKHLQFSLSSSSNWTEESIFLCNQNSSDLDEKIVDALDGLATQSRAQMNLKFFEIESTMKIKLNGFFHH